MSGKIGVQSARGGHSSRKLGASLLPISCAGLLVTQASWPSFYCASCCSVRSACIATMSKLQSIVSRIHWPVMGGQYIYTPSLAGASVSPQASYISMDHTWPGDATMTFIAMATLLQKRNSRKDAHNAPAADAIS